MHWLKDPRTQVYNFDPHLKVLTQPDQFRFEALPKFVPPSNDDQLHALARQHGAQWVSSTSSISGTLSMLYFLISRLRSLQLTPPLSAVFAEEPRTFTQMTRSPCAILLRPHGARLRSIQVEKGPDSPNTILMQMGHSLERMLTMEKEQFNRLLLDHPDPLLEVGGGGGGEREAYSHLLAGNLLLRSQLDCHDPRLPRKTFDLKTRATLPVRLDVANYANYREYRLASQHGLFGSFERELYDMARSALLKYNLQVRIGDMDGIFVAYHNTAEMFGFQYLSREQQDEMLYGNSTTGDAAFSLLLRLLNDMLGAIVPKFGPEQTIRLTMACDKAATKLTLFAEGLEDNSPSPSPSFHQYQLTCHSTVNGARQESILLSDDETWRVHYQLQAVKPSVGDFEAARRSITADTNRAISDDMVSKKDLPLFRNIFKSITKHRHHTPHGTEIIAPWAMLK